MKGGYDLAQTSKRPGSAKGDPSPALFRFCDACGVADLSELKRFLDVLCAPGNAVLEGNRECLRVLADRQAEFIKAERELGYGKAEVWHLPDASHVTGPRILVFPTGHLTFYGIHGRRILCTDPDGTPLHECEWVRAESGAIKMTRARTQLDCRQWVGIRPEATEQVGALDLSAQPGWQGVAFDELRQMVAKAWNVPLDDVRYFYPDESFTRDDSGHVTIRLKKDGVYLLPDGTFNRPVFVSYMGAVPWARIDLLNVVELYQSTLFGVGGAAFDLIWGLCDDQRLAEGPIPLRYRGLPTFPAEQAYGLFCAYFRPEAPAGEDPAALFMDHQRGYQIAWWPRPDPPWRYFDRAHGLCVTVQGGMVEKVNVIDDPVGIPYYNAAMKGYVLCDRAISVVGGTLQLRDGDRATEIPLSPAWGVTRETPRVTLPSYPFGWRALFGGGPPKVDPVRAWTTTLLFPDDESPVSEESTQLFVLELIYVYLNELPDLPSRLKKIHRVLIHNFDPVCAGFVNPDYTQRRYTVLYNRPEWAQKSAQVIWDRAARGGRLDQASHSFGDWTAPGAGLEAIRSVDFLPERELRAWTYGGKYELIYEWIPFASYDDPLECEAIVKDVARALAPRGLACVVGPPCVVSLLTAQGLRVFRHGGSEDLIQAPAVVEHFRIYPSTRVNPDLTIALGEKSD